MGGGARDGERCCGARTARSSSEQGSGKQRVQHVPTSLHPAWPCGLQAWLLRAVLLQAWLRLLLPCRLPPWRPWLQHSGAAVVMHSQQWCACDASVHSTHLE